MLSCPYMYSYSYLSLTCTRALLSEGVLASGMYMCTCALLSVRKHGSNAWFHTTILFTLRPLHGSYRGRGYRAAT